MVADEDPLIVRTAITMRRDGYRILRFFASTSFLREFGTTLSVADKLDIISFADLFANHELTATARDLSISASAPE